MCPYSPWTTPDDASCCVQVLTKAVKPPTPDAAKLAGVLSQQQLAMQHVRMQLARMVKKAHPAQVGNVDLVLIASSAAVLPLI